MPCCFCSQPAIHIGECGSGKDGDPQTWPFCSEYWRELTRQRADRDPFVLIKFLVLLQYLHGGYRMQRDFQGNQASMVLPGEMA
jgi:hypothetical protein